MTFRFQGAGMARANKSTNIPLLLIDQSLPTAREECKIIYINIHIHVCNVYTRQVVNLEKSSIKYDNLIIEN